MNYFVNEDIYTLNSGTEFSAIKRLKMFQNHGLKAKIVTRNFDPNASYNNTFSGLEEDDVINMYNYFQEILDVEAHDENVRYTNAINKEMYHIEGIDSNESLIKHHGKVIAKVFMAPSSVQLVGSIEYYNDFSQPVAKDSYDRRGFKSATQYYHPDGSPAHQVFFDAKGTPKMEVVYMNVHGTLAASMFRLLDYKGRVWNFPSENALFTFFLNELAAEEDSVFINDRPSLAESVAAVTPAVGKWNFLHGVHDNASRTKGASHKFLDYLKPYFKDYKDGFHGLMVATDLQKEEIDKNLDMNQVISVPDTYSDTLEVEKVVEPRTLDTIVYAGRIAADKKPIDMLDVFEMVHEVLPFVKFEMYGYYSPYSLHEEIEKTIKDKKLEDAVIYKNFMKKSDLQEAMLKDAVFLNTSDGEAFGMNVLEALSYGLPVVSYDVKYGIRDLIEDGKNGALIGYANRKQAAEKIVELLTHPDVWAEQSKAAYEKAREFNEERTWIRWQNAQQQIGNLYI